MRRTETPSRTSRGGSPGSAEVITSTAWPRRTSSAASSPNNTSTPPMWGGKYSRTNRKRRNAAMVRRRAAPQRGNGTLRCVVGRTRRHAIGWAAVIIGVLTVLRMMKGAGGPPYGVDASYYFQLARHIANGEGFVTTVSLYHEGWILPSKTTIYPLW